MADVYVNVPLKVQTLLNKDLYVTKIRKKSRLRWLFLALLLVLLPAGVYAQDDPITDDEVNVAFQKTQDELAKNAAYAIRK